MADAIGTAKLSLVVDMSDYTVALDRAEQKQKGLGAVAEQEAAKMTAAQRRVIASLDSQIAKLGLTREQWLQYKVITQTTGETQTQLLARIKANTVAVQQQGAAVKKTAIEFNQYGISAKQQVAALRQVPAQLTDIFVSLQGGQNPLTVLLQQGGQLKDIFGGIAPAARALGGAIMGLVGPWTLLAGVIGVAGAAYLSAESRANNFNKALILSGQAVNTNAEQLQGMADSLDNVSGVTSRQAAAALTEIVATGRIAAGQYELVAEAAARMEDVTGKAMTETIAEYAELGRDPTNALLKFNEAEGFLTASIYERVRALQESGQIEEAAALATETRANAQIQRTEQVVQSLGLVSGAWFTVKENTGEAWDAAVNYFTGLDRDAKEATRTLSNMWANFRVGGPAGAFASAAGLGPAVDPAAEAERKRISSEAIRQLDAIIAGNRTRAEQQELEETRIKNLGASAGKSAAEVNKLLAASQAAFKASQPKGKDGTAAARALANAEVQAQLQAIKNQLTQEQATIQNSTRLLQAQYAARILTTQEYYQQQRDLIQRGSTAEVQALEKQIMVLKSRDLAGKDSVDTLRKIGQLEAQLAKVRADGATSLAILGIQEADVLAKRKRALDSYTESLQISNEAAQRSVDASIARITLGDREADQQEKIAAILEAGANKQRELAQQLAETNDQALYDQKLAALQKYMDEQVRIAQDGYTQMKAAQADWLNGVQGGINNWMEGARDVASQTAAITTRTMDGIADAAADAALGVGDSWRTMLIDLGKEIVRFMAKQAVLKFIEMFASAYFSSGTSATTTGTTNTGSSFATFAADGGVFPGAAGLSKYSGTVVSQPTLFAFAKGAGVMGEDGDEGIFPLARGSDGKLGVKAMGMGGGGNVYLTVATTINNDGTRSQQTTSEGDEATLFKEFTSQMANIADQRIQTAMRPNGALWRAGVGS